MNGERVSANLPKIYLETTLFNYYHLSDPARRTEIDATKRLFEHVRERRFDPYVSEVVISELKRCPEDGRREAMLKTIADYGIPTIPAGSHEAFRDLAGKYVAVGAIPPHKMDDALHIAIASLSRMDILASWNCSHIVRYRTQQAVHDINLALGISPLAIHTPLELIY